MGMGTCLMIAGMAMGLSMPAMAQNALGDGRGLEANTRVGSGGRNYQRPSLEREVQFRNSIATGNAPGGMSFRGDLGYQAPGEFAGALGSDALYSFRRDSLYSGLAGMGIRGTDALQYQFSQTTGSRVTGGLVGNLSVSRYGGASSAMLSGGLRGVGDPVSIDSFQNISPSRSMASGTLRSTSSYTTSSGLKPELLSVYEEGIEKVPYGLVSSPLMGLVSTPMEMKGRRADPEADARRLTPARTSYDEALDLMRERASKIRERSLPEQTPDDGDSEKTPEEQRDDWVSKRIQDLQREVLGLPPMTEDEARIEDAVQGGAGDRDPIGDGVELRDPVNPYPDGEGIEGGAPKIEFDSGGQKMSDMGSRYSIDPETLELIRGDGKRVTYLVDPTAETKNFYDMHMVAGEGLLNKGRYFDAEERFTQALSIKPRDVSAQLGRLHAQIGAGLVLSASVNLQTLMTEHLEIVSRRYSDSLLPDEQRVRELILNLRERGGLEERASYVVPEPARVRVACGMLIAYLGYQVEDESQMIDGFGLVREFGTETDQRLVTLLETVWGAVLDDPGGSDPDDGGSEPAP